MDVEALFINIKHARSATTLDSEEAEELNERDCYERETVEDHEGYASSSTCSLDVDSLTPFLGDTWDGSLLQAPVEGTSAVPSQPVMGWLVQS